MAEIKMEFDDRKLQRGFVDIEKANVIASKNTLNTMAALTRRNAVRTIGSDFINRNNFTQRQIQFDKAEGEKLSSLTARVGATEKAGYMALQEPGGERKPSGSGKSLAIATNAARGGSKSSTIDSSLRLGRIKTSGYGRKKKPTSRKAKILRRAQIAFEQNKFLRTVSGIYRVISFNSDGYFKTETIYNSRERKARVKPSPWLEPSTDQPIRDGQNIYNSQINKLLKGDVF